MEIKSDMGKYMIKRILIAIPVLIGITIIDYAIMCLAGSPLQMLQGPPNFPGCGCGKGNRPSVWINRFMCSILSG